MQSKQSLFRIGAEHVPPFLLRLIGREVTLVQNIAEHLRCFFVRVEVSYLVPTPRRGVFLDKASLGSRLANFRDNGGNNEGLVGPC